MDNHNINNQVFHFAPHIANSDGDSQQHTTMSSFVHSYLLENQTDTTHDSPNLFYSYGRRNAEFQDSPTLQDNLNNLAISMPPIYSDYAANAPAMNCIGEDEVLQWDPHPHHYSDFASYDGTTSKFSNELSLTLATSQPSAIGNSSDRTSANSDELSYRGSPAILGSRYLGAVQEILAEIASFTLQNVDHSNAGYLIGSSSNSGAESEMADELCCSTSTEAKRAKLLALLQMVDDGYNQCVDEIHTVISAFNAATEIEPEIHTRFALRTICFLYKGLRERISKQCVEMGASFENENSNKSFETDFIQNQWALHQMKKKDHQLWRPQRGLPEKSVAVLRAWMFQNFLHPYPKDAEKHLLAIKSGLTRNQVSNWFINARVRLWKPMIEDMYAEMSRRKTRHNNNDTNQRSLASSSSTKNKSSLRYVN